MIMINPKKLINMVRKWQKLASIGSKRIPLLSTDVTLVSSMCPKSVADKGHFVVYTVDGRRFMLPLSYLSSPIFKELFKMSEDAFGLPGNRRITLPCDAVLMEYLVSLVQGRVSEHVVKALLISIATDRCSAASSFLDLQHSNQQILLHGC